MLKRLGTIAIVGALMVAGLAVAPAGASDLSAVGVSQFGIPSSELKLESATSSLGGEHFRYRQSVDGLPLVGATAVVSPSLGVAYGSVDQKASALKLAAPVSLSATNARAIAVAEFGGEPRSTDLVALRRGPEIRPVWQVDVWSHAFSVRTYVDAATGSVLDSHSRRREVAAKTSVQNPRSDGYEGTLSDCDSPEAGAELAPFRQEVTLQGLDESGLLVGEFADTTGAHLESPEKLQQQAVRTELGYDHTCDEAGYEEVLLYHQIDQTQRHLQSLGFTGESAILAEAFKGVAHFNDDENAFYDPETKSIVFGDAGAGADFAEDVDVVRHEYGHAILDAQVPNACPNGDQKGFCEGGAVHEGFGDLLAALSLGDPCIGEWTNFDTFSCDGGPGLRTTKNQKTYGDWIGEVHDDGEIWAGTIWQITEEITTAVAPPAAIAQAATSSEVRDRVLKTLLTAQATMPERFVFAQLAAAFIQANVTLYAGAQQDLIEAAFDARGITPDDTPPPIDDDAPTISVDQLDLVSPNTSLWVSWMAADNEAGTGISHYDVQVSEKHYLNGIAVEDDLYELGTTTYPKFNMIGEPGVRYCFFITAYDLAGNASEPDVTCTAIPEDDWNLAQSSGWKNLFQNGAFSGTISASSQKSAFVQLRVRDVQDIKLVVTRCPKCGRVDVLFEGELLKSLSLKAPRLIRKKVLNVVSQELLLTGKIVVRIVFGKSQIDGIALL